VDTQLVLCLIATREWFIRFFHTTKRSRGPALSNVNNIETKAQTFRYRSLLSERKQNVLIWSAYYRNESKAF
jgi:hypothetical protein